MTNKTLKMAIGAALLFPALAFAQVQVVNGEAGMNFRDAPSTVTRAAVLADMKAGNDTRTDGSMSVGKRSGRWRPAGRSRTDNWSMPDCYFLVH
jgi:hypothetical protein